MSNKYPHFVTALKELGVNVITAQTINELSFAEQTHADMQALKIKETLFLLKECRYTTNFLNFESLKTVKCKKDVMSTYPHNILLNFLYFNNTVYGKIKYADDTLSEYCSVNKISMVNVNQGYCKCSTAVLSSKAAITSDKSISKALTNDGADVLEISSGNILLDGCNYGFIGGAGGKINDSTYVFFGDISKHPDYEIIKKFFCSHNLKIKILCSNFPLTDIGGIVQI